MSQLSTSDAAAAINQKLTVQWYKGEASTTDPRASTTVRIGATNTAEVGARANEDAIKDALKSLAAASVSNLGTTTDTSTARWQAVAARATTLLPANGALGITADFSLAASSLSQCPGPEQVDAGDPAIGGRRRRSRQHRGNCRQASGGPEPVAGELPGDVDALEAVPGELSELTFRHDHIVAALGASLRPAKPDFIEELGPVPRSAPMDRVIAEPESACHGGAPRRRTAPVRNPPRWRRAARRCRRRLRLPTTSGTAAIGGLDRKHPTHPPARSGAPASPQCRRARYASSAGCGDYIDHLQRDCLRLARGAA